MAGLTDGRRPPSGPPTPPERTESRLGDRGQLLLVSGFALAVLLLALAVALNAATYTESYATRSDGVDDGDVATVQHGIERGVAGLIRATNAQQPTASYDDRKAVFARNIANWTALADHQAAADATAVNATAVNYRKGIRVWQNNSSRAFTSDDTNTTWTVANDVNATRGFEMNVSRASLANGTCPSDCFTVVVNETDGSDEWRMTVTANDTTITVSVDGPTSGSCSVRANDTVIELSAGRLAGDSCPALSFAEGIDGSYDIVYENGDEVAGTYEFVVDESISMDVFGSPPGPHAHPAIWSTEVRVTYRTPTVEYSRTVWVVPGEDDD